MARFIGDYQHTIDQKSRVIIPARWRETIVPEDGSGFYLTPGFDKCIFVYTPRTWQMEEERLNDVSYAAPEGRQFKRLFFARARFSECDGQGRILIEAPLKAAADLKKKVILVGVSDRIEIWDAQRWRSYEESAQDNFDRIAEGQL